MLEYEFIAETRHAIAWQMAKLGIVKDPYAAYDDVLIADLHAISGIDGNYIRLREHLVAHRSSPISMVGALMNREIMIDRVISDLTHYALVLQTCKTEDPFTVAVPKEIGDRGYTTPIPDQKPTGVPDNT